jgi:hypothetical protein
MVYKLAIPTGGSDEPPVCYLPVAENWRHVLLGLLERPLSDWFWDGTDEEIEAANAEVAKWIDYLEECNSVFAIVQGFTFLDCYIHVAGGMTWYVDGNQMDGGSWWSPAGISNESILEITPLLRAGAYDFTLFYRKAGQAGKFRLRVDGDYVDASYDMDLYGLSDVNNKSITVPIVVIQDGLHEIRIDNVGKNASATNYRLTFSGINLTRTGD